jgi:hypothetical protein
VQIRRHLRSQIPAKNAVHGVAVNSGWNKEGVSYTVEKNTLKIKVTEGGGDDADSIYLGSIKDCRTLTINISQISGKYPWGGKVIGFSFFNDKLEPS